MKIKKIINPLILVIFILIILWFTRNDIYWMYQNMVYWNFNAFGTPYSNDLIGILGKLIFSAPFFIIFYLFSVKNNYTKIFYIIVSSVIIILLLCAYLIFPIHKKYLGNQIPIINQPAIEKNSADICNNINNIYWIKRSTLPLKRAGYRNEFTNCVLKIAIKNKDANICNKLLEEQNKNYCISTINKQ